MSKICSPKEGTVKFRYLITSTYSGDTTGTNDKSVAEEISHSDEHYVVDCEACESIYEGQRTPIQAHE